MPSVPPGIVTATAAVAAMSGVAAAGAARAPPPFRLDLALALAGVAAVAARVAPVFLLLAVPEVTTFTRLNRS